MTAADKIAEARALIEPLTGHDDGPWATAHRGTRRDFQKGRDYHRVTTLKDADDPDAVAIAHVQRRLRRGENARLIAAAPALLDTVPVLADGWEAEKARADALWLLLREGADLLDMVRNDETEAWIAKVAAMQPRTPALGETP